MKYDFDTVYDRHHTNCAKYDSGHTDDPDMIPMWVADMDFKTLPDIPEALSKRVLDGIYGYSTIPEEYLESVVGWMERRHDFRVEKDWIVPTPGVVTAFHLAVEAYTKKEESVLVLTPVYYPFYRAIKNNGRRMVRMPLDLKDNQYTLDYKAFETKIIEENVKMMIFCNPHNPVGKVW
uniref:aminotransferase class I/II-fold pyridoxal phosphate-dependent enzyme n=1 Tax=Catenibacterium sp. TaxID=2049022 RepID=UPI00307909CE